jgi:NAD(P)-dependent dehydrogenase (short-subunit alcohol dehydrogenase family)
VREFAGKTAVITGGASGIGLGLARRFLDEGMHVVIGDVEKRALDAVVDELGVTGVLTDVTDPAQMQALADVAVDAHGGVDIFCNNAGVGGGGLSWEMPLSTWEWVINVDLWGVIHGVRTFVPLLMQRPEAHIVNTASMAGLVAAPFMGPYNAAKHGVVAISESLYKELAMMAPHVGVSVLCPGWVNTNIADSSRNRPEHLALPALDEAGMNMDTIAADALKDLISSGMPPEMLAGKVLDAIRAEQFWILTHADQSDQWVDAMRRRHHQMENQENPPPGFLV